MDDVSGLCCERISRQGAQDIELSPYIKTTSNALNRKFVQHNMYNAILYDKVNIPMKVKKKKETSFFNLFQINFAGSVGTQRNKLAVDIIN